MKEIQLRRAVLDDLDTLLEFEQGIIEAERPFDETLKEEKISYYDLKAFILDPDTEVVVAESDGKPVGSGYARIMDAKSFLKHGKYAYLGFMYVHPEYRGRGINKRIVDALKQWSLSRNISEIRLDVYSDNLAAIRAYEKAGFQRHLLNMRIASGSSGEKE
ncbi:GNAT family N-acetyltransferase [Sinomicrobium weinanense]|uniref:GNAT family N-acetyltransferase n=1 Tax=Sinomicrobium weinanense TaxID=2842200 RepID=A0A926Q632_9FLAO|nr:GNAT family N-acetyltransferase [Sinomicrobium weinanense]MBC9798625.1 GNAT family N-acetyltransferase [Sinomicrobium weinanense]MBU3122482.1 GNAT family N-acetyltransferase [Sinomicrobium weinanense]